jgi:hypothetical protein
MIVLFHDLRCKEIPKHRPLLFTSAPGCGTPDQSMKSAPRSGLRYRCPNEPGSSLDVVRRTMFSFEGGRQS